MATLFSVTVQLSFKKIFTCAALNIVNIYMNVKRVYIVCRVCFSQMFYLEATDYEIQWEHVHRQNMLVQFQADRSIVKSQ